MNPKPDPESLAESLRRDGRAPGVARTLFALMTADRSSPAAFTKDVRESRPRHTLQLIVAIFGIGVVAMWLLEASFYPWARSLTGGPTLVGEWQGELTTPTGHHRVVRFVVNPLPAQVWRIPINATARMCDERGDTSDFEAWGDTDNWRGTRFSLKTRTADDRPVGLKFGDLQGEWNAETVQLSTTLRTDPDVSSTLSEIGTTGRVTTTRVGDPDTLAPITVTLRRGSEKDFVEACRRMGSLSGGQR